MPGCVLLRCSTFCDPAQNLVYCTANFHATKTGMLLRKNLVCTSNVAICIVTKNIYGLCSPITLS